MTPRGAVGARVGAVVLVLVLAAVRPGSAQQLEPRAYAPAPVGANFVGMGYMYSSGDILVDPTLPLDDVSARVNFAVPFYLRTFGWFGHVASAGITWPYARGTVEGNVFEERRRADRSGLADVSCRLAVSFVGGSALSPREFAARKPSTTVGASLVVTAPTGQYDPAKLINLGANRWAFKPELGLSHPHGPWWLEAYAGVWLFTANRDFFGGQFREQDPIGAAQGHVVRTFKPGLWASLDGTYYYGGATTLDGLKKADRQANSRAGATLALPIGRGHALKLAYARGVSARIGSKQDSYAILWQYLWFDKQGVPAGR
jgi:hypothetical protein